MAKKSLRFHAAIKMISDYQLVTKYHVAVSRHELCKPGRGRRVEPALAPEKGGDPRQWGGPAEPSVSAWAYGN